MTTTNGPTIDFVLYHPRLGFLLDTEGAWSTDRDQASVHTSHSAAYAFLRAAIANGLDPRFLHECLVLPWWT